MPLAPGDRLGPYEVLGPLGAGGMGEVYRARDGRLDRDVAIKILPELFTADPDRLMRFEREAKSLAALNHSGIAQIYGVEEASSSGSGRPARALVMELVEGEDLSVIIARGPVPLEQALPIAAQIADALEAAHEAGIVHRDLKPANVKVRPDGAVKVLDFGLATAPPGSGAGSLAHSPTFTSPALTQMGVVLGTAAYMAPEQARGRFVDKRADIWAFGVVLYEMLTGRRAFDGEDVSDTLAAVLRQDVDLSLLPADVPAALRHLLERCLTRQPRERLRDIGEARLLIERIRAGRGDGAGNTAAPAAPVPARTPAWKIAVITAGCVLGAAALTGYGAWTLRPAPAAPIARFELPLPDGQTLTGTARRAIAVSPDGTAIAYVANRQIFVRTLADPEPRAIPGAADAAGIQMPVFSPDGQWIAFRPAAGATLKKIRVAGGAAVTICALDPGASGLAWAPDGIYFAEPGKGILRVSAAGGEPEVIVPVGPGETPDSPQPLPGGKAVLLSVKKSVDGWAAGQTVVYSLRDGTRKALVEGVDASYLQAGYMVYAVSGVLFAARFNPDTLEVGEARPVVEGVRRGATAVAQYAWSSNGLLAYLPGPLETADTATRDLAIFDLKGAPRPLKLPPGPYAAPRVSPDGRWVAVDRDDGVEAAIWVYELSGQTAIRRLTFGGRSRYPVWSPDSRWIAFQSDRDGSQALYRQLADGTGSAERLTTPDADEAHTAQSWSPDGRTLLYAIRSKEAFSLGILTLDSGKTEPFAGVASARAVEATFSPDGRWVAYAASETTATGLTTYVVPFPPSGAKYMVPVIGGHPFWSPKGDVLTVNSSPGVSNLLRVTTRPQFGFGPPETFSRGPRYESNPATTRRNTDPLPDGRLVGVMVGDDPGAAGEIRQQVSIVMNWFEDLRQRFQ